MSVILAVLDAVDAGTLNIPSHALLLIHYQYTLPVTWMLFSLVGAFFLKTSLRVLIK